MMGAILRKCRLDELPQLFDVICGNMSFVGTRPELVQYVKQYKPAFNATLLLPAGITSECCIRYKDEDKLLGGGENVDMIYVEQVLPKKMKMNLEGIKCFSLHQEVVTMFRTILAIF